MRRTIIALVSLSGLLALCLPPGQAAAARPTERIIGVGFEDVVDHPQRLPKLAKRLDQVKATGVSLSVGRVDWAAFPWEAGPHTWSGEVRRTQRDYVAAAMAALGRSAAGQRRSVILVLDTLVAGWIAKEPGIAGIDANGRRSEEFPSLAQLQSGQVGNRIVAFAGAVAARYHPQAVSLTELFNASHTFGADDRASYMRFSGARDWPRTETGGIHERHPSIARWRSAVISGLVARARAATHASGVDLWMEVRVNWSNPKGDRLESGHDYELLLNCADRLVLWGYFATEQRKAKYLRTVARVNRARAPGRMVMSVGMWADHDRTISPRQLRVASRATVQGGMRSVWVTPTSRISPAHWKSLKREWARR